MKPITRLALRSAVGVLVVALLFSVACGPAPTQPRVLRIWQTEVDPKAVAVLREVADELERTHPGVKVEIESVGWGALSSKLVTALSAGDPPDVTQLQPFMAASMQSKGLLEPIDDVIASLNPDDIYPAVRDLQRFDGHWYGIGYAMGITYFSYRKDISDAAGLAVPKTWAEYLAFVKAMPTDRTGGANVLLPGGDPFFIDQLTVELLSANGGRLFDENNRPQFTDPRFVEMLRFLQALAKSSPADWPNEKYVDQFKHFAAGRALNVPVTYARAANQIDADASKDINDPQHFAVMPQPVGPAGTQSYATLDAEAWAVFHSSKNVDLAKEFLKLFYRKDHYLKFCQTVPMHLTPIFQSMAESPEYQSTPMIAKWRPWQEQQIQFIRDKRVRPIFVSEEADLGRTFLLEFQGSRVVSDLVLAVAKDGQDPEQAAREAQAKAEQLVERLGARKW